MIDLTIHRQALDRNIQKARESGVVIPTFENMKHPETVPEPIRARLRGVGLWDVDPLNLFRITWKNEPMESGGLYRAVPNYIELPPALTGVPARIIALVGKWFPTGCHKVGASFGCLAPGWSPDSSTPGITGRCGPPPATTAGAARSTPSCWGSGRWPSSRRA